MARVEDDKGRPCCRPECWTCKHERGMYCGVWRYPGLAITDNEGYMLTGMDGLGVHERGFAYRRGHCHSWVGKPVPRDEA